MINLRKGAVIKTVPTGAGAKSVATDPRSGRVLVANRTTATVTVVDPREGTVVDSLTTGANTNHVHVAHGAAFVAAKSGSGPGARTSCTDSPSGTDTRHRGSVRSRTACPAHGSRARAGPGPRARRIRRTRRGSRRPAS